MMIRMICGCLAFLWIPLGSCKADLIDFEQFDVGDGLTEINAFYNPLGIEFLSDGGVGTIQMVGGSKAFGAFTPNANTFDVLINFSFLIDNISVDMLENGGDPDTFSVLEGYDNHKTPTSDVAGFLFSEFGDASINLSFDWPGPGISQVRTLHFSQDLASNDFVTIDNIQFTSVPEPAGTVCLILIGIGIGIGLRRRAR